MPKSPKGTVQRRSVEELAAARAALSPKKCGCGHVGIAANEYYAGRSDDCCVECYREHYREAQRRKKQTDRAPLKRAQTDAERRDRLPQDPEVQAALGVLRDARGQREGRQGYVYMIIEVMEGGGLRYCKIGYSTKPTARVPELQTGNPRPLKLHALKKGTLTDEAALHTKYIHLNVQGEWFNLNHSDGKELLLEFDLDGRTGLPWGQKGDAPQ